MLDGESWIEKISGSVHMGRYRRGLPSQMDPGFICRQISRSQQKAIVHRGEQTPGNPYPSGSSTNQTIQGSLRVNGRSPKLEMKKGSTPRSRRKIASIFTGIFLKEPVFPLSLEAGEIP